MLTSYKIINIETGERCTALLVSFLKPGEIIKYDAGTWRIIGLQ